MLKEIEHNITQEANGFDEGLIDLDPTDHLNFYLKEAKKYRFPCLSLQEEINLSNRIQNGLVIKDAKKATNLSNIILNEDAKDAFTVLVNKNLLLSVKCAFKFSHNNNELTDLIQCGNLGLMDAAIKYDSTLKNKFSTYAYYLIKNEIIHYVRCKKLIVLPSNFFDNVILVKKKYEFLTQTLKRFPNNEELSKFTGLSIDIIKQMKIVTKSPLSLDQQIDFDSDDERIDIIADKNCPDIIDNIEVQINFKHVLKIIRKLYKNNKITKRNIDILLYRCGFIDGVPHTLEETGKLFKLTKQSIDQIESSFSKKVKELIPKELVNN